MATKISLAARQLEFSGDLGKIRATAKTVTEAFCGVKSLAENGNQAVSQEGVLVRNVHITTTAWVGFIASQAYRR